MKPDYGTYIPRWLSAGPLGAAGLLLGLSFLRISPPAKVLLRFTAALWALVGGYMTYARLAMADEELKQRLCDAFLSQLPWDGQGKALDVGTGAGLMAIGLARRNPQAQVIGVDIWAGPLWGEKGVGFSQTRCEQNAIAEGVADQVRFEHASAIDLPYADGEFDAVISSYVFHEIHQVKDKRVLLWESLRVLRPGGAFAFLDPFHSKAYGGPQDLLVDLRTKGLSAVGYADLSDLGTIPPLLQLITHGSGILYGVK